MAGLLIGHARVSTDDQDLTVQCDALAALGVAPERVYVDHGLAGTNRDRPGLREALAACRAVPPCTGPSSEVGPALPLWPDSSGVRWAADERVAFPSSRRRRSPHQGLLGEREDY